MDLVDGGMAVENTVVESPAGEVGAALPNSDGGFRSFCDELRSHRLRNLDCSRLKPGSRGLRQSNVPEIKKKIRMKTIDYKLKYIRMV